MPFFRLFRPRFALLLLMSVLASGATTALVEGANHRIADLGIELVWLAAGSFAMGGDEGGGEAKPVLQVTLTKGFWLGKTEVTQAQYLAVIGANPSSFKGAGRDAPVENVSWMDAMEFCRKITERERAAGRLPEGCSFTLPSEAQWEFACRAGGPIPRSGELDALAWHGGNSADTTHAVGQKRANPWGLHDVYGNVWEWCLDWYAERLPGGSVTDPIGAASTGLRVIRGGGWGSAADVCHPAFRWGSPDFCYTNLGFRLALGLSQPAQAAARSEAAGTRARPARARTGNAPQVRSQ